MNLACVTFTQRGIALAKRLQSEFQGTVALYTKQNYKAELPAIFQQYQGIVFIAATGIAVRLSAPFLQGKTRDPAIVVVDDLGRYAISLVSGHVGGANALAREIAAILECQPVITTASDGRGFEAVDLFAKHHELVVENWQDVKTLTAMMVEEQPIRLISEIEAVIQYQHLVEENPAGCLYVTSQEPMICDVPHCVLRPKNLSVGLGCRKGKTAQEIFQALTTVFRQHRLSLNSIWTIATITLKQDEPGIREVCRELGIELSVFTQEQIQRIEHQFAGSQFVKATVGVASVCEPCAVLAGGDLIVEKTAINGVTIAVAKRKVTPQTDARNVNSAGVRTSVRCER